MVFPPFSHSSWILDFGGTCLRSLGKLGNVVHTPSLSTQEAERAAQCALEASLVCTPRHGPATAKRDSPSPIGWMGQRCSV